MEPENKKVLGDLLAESTSTSYSGVFDSSVLTAFSKKVEGDLVHNPKLSKKIFKIFIELAQNIALYSSDKVASDDKSIFNGYGLFFLREYHDHFQLITGNMAFKEDAQIVKEKCDRINSMTREELREFKRLMRKKPASQKGGGNIGLVQIVLTSNSYIDYEIIDVDANHSFLIFSIDIKKED